MKKILKIILATLILAYLSVNSFAGTIANNYSSEPYVSFGRASFSNAEKVLTPFEHYSELDSLGRCGMAFALICKDIMPTSPRGSIGMIKPSGWQIPQSKYDFIEGKFLYNRCHLIAYSLAGENANEKNLITGTRYMNVQGMLPFENMVANHVRSTSHHVLYRSTPIFEGNNLLCEGVQLEAYCLEENGGVIDFNVFCFNVQPGVEIDYATGKNCLSNNAENNQKSSSNNIANNGNTINDSNSTNTQNYVLNINSHKIHLPSCSSVQSIKEKNKKLVNDSIQNLKKQGYTSCKICNP